LETPYDKYIHTKKAHMPNAIISEFEAPVSSAPAGETVTVFKNRCFIEGVGQIVFMNYEVALLQPDGSVIETLCQEQVEQTPGDYSGLSYGPAKREPLRCDPEPLGPDEVSSFDYELPDKDVDTLRFGFRVWLSQNGEPTFPAFGSPSTPENVSLWTISYPVEDGPVSVEALGAVAGGGIVGFSVVEFL
jgi:hypothetical protein